MKKVIITGASGMIGGLVLQECLNDNRVAELVSLVRKPSGIQHHKLKEHVVSDFTNYAELQNLFENIDVAYFCIGVYTGVVEREEFRKITVDYTIAFVDTLKYHSPNARMCFLSGAGADRTEKSRMMFAKDKGIAENYLVKAGLAHVHSFRPAYIYPVTKRNEPNFSYRLTRWLYPLFKLIMPNTVITSVQLAKAIFKVGIEGGNQFIYENTEIKKL